MKFGIRKWLEPGEEVLFDSRGGFAGVRYVALILGAQGIAIGAGFMVSAYLRKLAQKAGTLAEPDGAISSSPITSSQPLISTTPHDQKCVHHVPERVSAMSPDPEAFGGGWVK